jgi:hypothetical protein
MAMNVTFSTLYLGTMSDLDWDEGDTDMESASSLIGTYGSAGAPLYKDRTDVVTNSPNDGFGDDYDDVLTADHSDNGTPDTLSYDLGAGPVTTQLDSAAQVDGTITFADGTTLTDTFVVPGPDRRGVPDHLRQPDDAGRQGRRELHHQLHHRGQYLGSEPVDPR